MGERAWRGSKEKEKPPSQYVEESEKEQGTKSRSQRLLTAEG